MFKKILFFLLLIVCLPIKAGTIDPNTADSKYIEYGSKFKCIYNICGSYEDNGLYCASAVVIDPHWVLTAAHVVDCSKICIVHQDDKAYRIDKIIVHNKFESKTFGYYDIALCYSANPIILDFYPKLYDDENEVGKVCSISGYGFTGNFNTGINKSDNIKRAGSNKIDKIEKGLLICSPSSFNRTELEFLIASGDSGGGLFIDGKLAGINSCVIADDKNTNSSYTDESGHTRISLYRDWINDNISAYNEIIKNETKEKK